MKNLAVRLTLLFLFVAAAWVTAYLIWKDTAVARARSDAARTFDERALAVVRGVMDLRAAQQAYVAAGQGEDFWTARVSAALTDLGSALASLRADATSAHAQSAFEAAGAALQDFERMDRRARDYATAGQKLLASDVIFSDGLDMTRSALASVDEGRAAEQQARADAANGLLRRQFLALGLTGALGILVLVLLVPHGGAAAGDAASASKAADRSGALGDIDFSLRLDDNKEWLRRGLEPFDAAQGTPFDRAQGKPAPAVPEPVDLTLLASLCADLARIVDTRSLPSVLERASSILDASGVVLWIADPDGRELTPIASHGYSSQLVTRLGNLKRDAENATAAAFRTGLVQTVKADAVSNGAIAAPLVSPAGAVGVMAAEVRKDGEKHPAKLAAAAILAAQLATLVGPPVSRPQSKAEAAGA